MRKLIEKAKEVAKNAYSPYSGIKVGSALLTKSGKIFTGCNVENVSYSLTVCAERVAILKAVSEGEKEFEKIVIYSDKMMYPCGACLQVMAEFNPDMEIIIVDKKENIKKYSLKEILRFPFKL